MIFLKLVFLYLVCHIFSILLVALLIFLLSWIAKLVFYLKLIDFMVILVSFHPTTLLWKSEFIPSSRSKSRPNITLYLLVKMRAVTLTCGSLILTSALYDVKHDSAIKDHLFEVVFLVSNSFVRTNESWMVNALTLLSIRNFI